MCLMVEEESLYSVKCCQCSPPRVLDARCQLREGERSGPQSSGGGGEHSAATLSAGSETEGGSTAGLQNCNNPPTLHTPVVEIVFNNLTQTFLIDKDEIIELASPLVSARQFPMFSVHG